MRIFLLIICSCLLFMTSAVAQQDDPFYDSIVLLYEDEERGLRHYERGEHEKAFEYLSRTAVRGLKKSQYILAFMFLKGEHVERSILLGMGWLGVAAESGEPEWQSLFDGLYERSNPQQRQMIDSKVDQYVSQYGMKAMNVSCALQPVTGSRRQEVRCLKSDGPADTIYPVEMRP